MNNVPPLDDRVFTLDALGRVELRANECTRCGARFHPPRSYCGRCSSPELRPVHLEPVGRLESYTVIAQTPPGSLIQAPYVLADILLDGGIRMRCVSPQAEGIRLGARVRLGTIALDPDGETRAGLVFYPVQEDGE